LCEDNFGRGAEFTKGAHPFDGSEGKVENKITTETPEKKMKKKV